MIRKTICLLALGGLFAFAAGVRADDSALLGVLVKKGILTRHEAEKLEAEIGKEPAAASQGGRESRLKIGDWVQELDLYGDMRFREFYQNYEAQLPSPKVNGFDKNTQGQRLRFRLRLDADFKLADNFFGGVQFTTSDNRNGATTNATYTSGVDNYNIYISRAFVGWSPIDGLTCVIGKQHNPFYTTELNWARDVGPTGVVERIDFHSLFWRGSGSEPVGYSKNGKAPPGPAPSGFPLELSLIAGQFTFFNNNADSSFSFNETDAYLFETQLLGHLKLFGGVLRITEGPTIQIWNEAGLGPTATLSGGKPNPASAPVGGSGTSRLGSLNNDAPFPVSTRNEFYLQGPGDIAFRLAGLPVEFYWDQFGGVACQHCL